MTTTEITKATSGELHALWGMLEAEATLGSLDAREILLRWADYVTAQRERFGR